MNNARSWTSVLAFNLLVLLAMLGALLITPPLISMAHSAFRGTAESTGETDYRATLPNLREFTWAARHFEEIRALETDYRDYLVWRRRDYAGETITIEGGLRRTVDPVEIRPDSAEFHFFGGSTTWGSGVSDETTYPSIFSTTAGVRAFNHGESGYIARQSLADLVNLYSRTDADPVRRVIVFYDGVNDVANRCRTEVSPLGTVRERQIDNALKASREAHNVYAWSETFAQLRTLVSSIVGADEEPTFREQAYRCKDEPARAREIAGSLVNEWLVASRLAHAHGDEFVAILQPVAYFGSPEITHMKDVDAEYPGLREQYQTVYPLIAAAAARHPELDFLDLSDSFDGATPYYIDWCHVSPGAHDLLVGRLIDDFEHMNIL